MPFKETMGGQMLKMRSEMNSATPITLFQTPYMTYFWKRKFFSFFGPKMPKKCLNKSVKYFFSIFQNYYVTVSYSSPACQFSAKSNQKQRNDTPLKIKGLDRFLPVRILWRLTVRLVVKRFTSKFVKTFSDTIQEKSRSLKSIG